ncbi:MAG: hypothetical protein ACK481_08895 [Candidatus Melainabacteria bacterium]|jgi:hypothetical protein
MSKSKNKKTPEEISKIKKRLAETYLESEFCSAVTIHSSQTKFTTEEDYQPNNIDLYHELKNEVSNLLEADLNNLQRRLASQAIVLEKTSNTYLLKMTQSQYINQTEAYSKIALKAQEQARKTLATIAEIKNPKRIAFIKQLQMNQFNNNVSTEENSKNFTENENELNKIPQLKGGEEYATLDIRSKKQAVTEVQKKSALA